MRWDEAAAEIAYSLKPKGGYPCGEAHVDPFNFLARVPAHIPQARLQWARCFGHDSNLSRGRHHNGVQPGCHAWGTAEA